MAAVSNAPFAWPQFKGPTSKVLKEKPSEWQDAGILVPHETIRWWDSEMMEAVNAFDPIAYPHTAWKTKVLFNYLENYYVPCIHHHHDAEEKVYNPAILDKVLQKGKQDPFPKIKTDHAQLLQLLGMIPGFRKEIEAGKKEAVAEFKKHMAGLVKFMEEHLGEEEIMYPKALRDSEMTEQEEIAVVQKIIEGLGLDGNKRFLPAILYAMCMWQGEAEMQKWAGQALPPPIRLLLNKCWLEDFYQNQLRPLQALKRDEHFEQELPSCGCAVM